MKKFLAVLGIAFFVFSLLPLGFARSHSHKNHSHKLKPKLKKSESKKLSQKQPEKQSLTTQNEEKKEKQSFLSTQDENKFMDQLLAVYQKKTTKPESELNATSKKEIEVEDPKNFKNSIEETNQGEDLISEKDIKPVFNQEEIDKIIDVYREKNDQPISEPVSEAIPKPSTHSATITVSKPNPEQGEAISVMVKSPSKVIKVFGNVGGKKISFLNISKNQVFQGFVGFDIMHPVDKVKVLIGVLFFDHSVRYLEQEIEVNRKIVTKLVPIYVTQKQWMVKKFKYKGKTKHKKVQVRVRVKKMVEPPLIVQQNLNSFKTLEQFQQEVEEEVMHNYKTGLGGYDDEEDMIDSDIAREDGKEENKEKTKKNTDPFSYFYNSPSPQQFWSGPFEQPSYPEKDGRISSRFGSYRVFALRGAIISGYHRGLDIAKPQGSPVNAPNHGMVVITGYYPGRGNSVMIDHGGGVYSVHYHLSKINVEEGMFVRKGQLIGLVGTTGQSTGPHLHWEIRVNGVSVDPIQWKDPAFINSNR